jgi:hypothetical protein
VSTSAKSHLKQRCAGRGLGASTWCLATWIAFVSVGCGDDDPISSRACAEVMLDSVGGEYPRGDAREGCFPAIGRDSPVGFDGRGESACDDLEYPAGVVFAWGRFFESCPGCGPLGTSCRPFVCVEDEDCPAFYVGGPDEAVPIIFECRGGLCQQSNYDWFPPERVTPSDAWLACLAPVERGDPYAGPDPCPGVDDPLGTCPLPLPDVCLQPHP